jgi:hypothetical protein
MVNVGQVRELKLKELDETFEGGDDAGAKEAYAKKMQDCVCCPCDFLIFIILAVMFAMNIVPLIANISANPNGGAMFGCFAYLLVVRLFWSCFACCAYSMPKCGQMCRCPLRGLFGLVTFIVIIIGLAIPNASALQRLATQYLGAAVGNAVGSSLNAVTNAANQAGNAAAAQVQSANNQATSTQQGAAAAAALSQASASIGSAFGGLFQTVLQSTIQPLVSGAIYVTFVLYYILPLVYTMGLLLSFCMCAESAENWVVSMAHVKVQTRNIVLFIFCLKMCRADAADAIASDSSGDNTTSVHPGNE